MTDKPMDPNDVPEELVTMMADAELDAPPGCSAADSYRTVLAAVIPAIRAATLAQLQTELVKLRAACTYQDELAAQYRIGLTDALDALDRTARGDQ